MRGERERETETEMQRGRGEKSVITELGFETMLSLQTVFFFIFWDDSQTFVEHQTH